jgi:hypothetical protein
MKKVFIGGSRKISRLNPRVRERLERIIENNLQVLIGDANGADKAVQQYFSDHHYRNVHVFCMAGRCRNNISGWPVEEVPAPRGVRGAEFYAFKDRVMTERSSCGLMLWDGKSAGTLANVIRLIEQSKPVVVYLSDTGGFETLKNRENLDAFLERRAPETLKVISRRRAAEPVLLRSL